MFTANTCWVEVQHCLWVCRGCSRACRIVNMMQPKQHEDCDHSEESVKQITREYGGPIGGD